MKEYEKERESELFKTLVAMYDKKQKLVLDKLAKKHLPPPSLSPLQELARKHYLEQQRRENNIKEIVDSLKNCMKNETNITINEYVDLCVEEIEKTTKKNYRLAITLSRQLFEFIKSLKRLRLKK